MSRSAIFLDEMGVGPQWRLRNAAPAMFEADPETGGQEAAAIAHGGEAGIEPAGVMTPTALASGAAPAAGQPPFALPPAASSPGEDATAWFDEAPAIPMPSAGARPPSSAAQAPGAAQRPAGSAAPSAPAQQRAAAAQQPAARPPAAASADDDSTAWFDEAPAIPMPSAAQAPSAAQRPAGSAAPSAPAQQRAAAVQPPAAGADESTAWFDDVPAAVPAAGRAAPAAPFDDGDAARGPVSAEAIANMDWPALQAAVRTCTRCELCETRKAAVPGRGDAHAQWLVLATAPNEEDEQQQRPVSAEPGQLLDNMLKAISLAPEEDAYVTTLVKCRPPGDRLPNPDELSACRPYLERELELAGTRAILTLGHTAGKGLLGAAARGKVLRHDGIPTIATYHPADLLRKPGDKARAWADLCLAKAAHAGRA